MRLRQKKAFKAITTFLVFAVAQVCVQISFAEPNPANTVLPAPQQFIARLTTRGNQPITVNGNRAATGASIVTGALIETGPDQAATVNLGAFGTLEIGANTKVRLDYDDFGNVDVRLITGCVVLRTRQKAEGRIMTDIGSTDKTDRNRGGMLDVCFIDGKAVVNQGAAAAAGVGAGPGTAAKAAGTGGGISTGAKVAIALVGLGGAVGAIAGASGGGDGGGVNPSPSSP